MTIQTYKKVIQKCEKCGHQVLKPRNGDKEPCQNCLEKKINQK